MLIFNTRSRSKEEFIPSGDVVGIYTCGPTVYHYAHIGNLRTYISQDLLVRVLKYLGYKVKRVMNITDVGHLQSDGDDGIDKMEIASIREKRTPWDVAKFYEQEFLKDMHGLKLLEPDVLCRATCHVQDMIDMIVQLQERGYTYNVDNNIYFDISKFPKYQEFGKLKLENDQIARVDADHRKKNPQDFVLWFTASKHKNQAMQWDSPWGVGFPGWHIECSAMSYKYLGINFDIHCGGIDHIPVHHTNEIAQSEAALGLECWVRYWMHTDFLLMQDDKMSKSKGDFLTLNRLIEQGFDPIHYKFFCLNSHYRSQLNFTFQGMEYARKDFEMLKTRILNTRYSPQELDLKALEKEFVDAISDDLDSRMGLAVLRKAAKMHIHFDKKIELLCKFDEALGIGVAQFDTPEITNKQFEMIQTRVAARSEKNWKLADVIRADLESQGISLNDEPDGSTSWFFTPR